MKSDVQPYGMIAEFRTAASVLHAAEKVRNAGFRKWDVYMPFPIHGMDKAMGIKNSKVGWFSFLGGVSNPVYNINQVSLRQAITPQRFLGRMNATMRFLVWGTIPIGSLIGAGLSEVIGVRNTVWVGSLLGLLPFLFVLFSPVRGLVKFPDTDPDADADAGSDSGAVAASAA